MPVGNDVIDLVDPESAPWARHPRFAPRVCCPDELAVVAAAADPNRTLWAHWAAKESSFKAFRQVFPDAPYIPRRLHVRLRWGSARRALHAIVRMGRCLSIVQIEHAADHLHAIARVLLPAEPRDSWSHPVDHGVRRLSCPTDEGTNACTERASETVRKALLDALATQLDRPRSGLSIDAPRRRGTAPAVLIDGNRSGIEISLSHHGSLVAFAFVTPRESCSAGRNRR